MATHAAERPNAAIALRRSEVLHAICRLEPDSELPSWITLGPPPRAAVTGPARGTLTCIARTAEELSIVTPDAGVPAGVRAERGFVLFSVIGPIDFAVVGLLARLTTALAQAGVPVIALSTFDTDHLLVRDALADRAVDALRAAGCAVEREA